VLHRPQILKKLKFSPHFTENITFYRVATRKKPRKIIAKITSSATGRGGFSSSHFSGEGGGW